MGYIRITAGKFRLEDSNGNPAAQGKVYTYTAGTTTAHASYSNKECTVANTNPIILDERGECELYTNTALKLIATDLNDVVIWTEDYQGEQEEEFIVSGNSSAGTINNNYILNVTPTFTSIPANLTIVMNPDSTNVTTMTSESTVGVTGINDLVWQGPYVGTTSGSVFSVQIDGTTFMGTGLNDLTFSGGLAGSVHTVQISTAAATDKFQWRKNGGAWSAEISITGAAQVLDADVSVTFAATTGHTLNDLWNNKDTFQWKKDGGAWTTGVPIYPRVNTPQVLEEGIGILFSIDNNHTLNDVWALTVTTPARLNFCGLGNKLIYKNVAGVLKALDGGDIVQGIPASLVYSAPQDVFILLNPSLPVLAEVQPTFIMIQVNGNYTVTTGNARQFLNCSNGGTITLESCAVFTNKDLWISSFDGSQITVQIKASPDVIKPPFGSASVTSLIVGPGGWDCVRFASNGAYYKVVEAVSPPSGAALFTYADTGSSWVAPDGVTEVLLIIGAGGGGGAFDDGSGNAPAGNAGEVFQTIVTTVPKTSYLITIGKGGDPGNNTGHFDGYAGGTTSLGALASKAGGAGGVAGTGTGLGPENTSYVGESFGDFCSGGRGGDNSAGPFGGKNGFIRIQY